MLVQNKVYGFLAIPLFLVLPVEACSQTTSSVGSAGGWVPSAPVGHLATDCSTLQVLAMCTFVPGEDRSYVIDVIAKTCVAADTNIGGVPQIEIVATRRQVFLGGCRIAEGYVTLKGGVEVHINATSRVAGGRAVPVKLKIRKN